MSTIRILSVNSIIILSLSPVPAAASGGGSHPSHSPKAFLSLTGLYSNIATKTIAPQNLMFSPQYPLWSDGAKKKRWIYIPQGRTIDSKRVDDWIFPVGTKVWKEFTFAKRVETRYLEKRGNGKWRMATYAWDDQETDARLVPELGLPNHVEIAPGIRHNIPGVADCKACHEGQGRDVILGFNAIQLSPDRDPNAPHAEPLSAGMINLKTLADRHLVAHLPKRFLDTPPVISARTPLERTALGYLSANCGGCHNSIDPLATLGMYLKQWVEATPEKAIKERETVIGHKSKYQIPGLVENESYRIFPGDPSRSAIVFRMASRNPYQQMPPLGTKIVDREAVDLITKWIKEDVTRMNGEKLLTNQ